MAKDRTSMFVGIGAAALGGFFLLKNTELLEDLKNFTGGGGGSIFNIPGIDLAGLFSGFQFPSVNLSGLADNIIGDPLEGIKETFGDFIDSAKESFGELGESIGDGAKKIVEIPGGFADDTARSIKNAISSEMSQRPSIGGLVLGTAGAAGAVGLLSGILPPLAPTLLAVPATIFTFDALGRKTLDVPRVDVSGGFTSLNPLQSAFYRLTGRVPGLNIVNRGNVSIKKKAVKSVLKPVIKEQTVSPVGSFGPRISSSRDGTSRSSSFTRFYSNPSNFVSVGQASVPVINPFTGV